MGINYGSNKVRYPSVVPVGSRIRAGIELVDVAEAKLGRQIVMRTTVELEGSEKPACVAETLALLVP
jgi:acyl dehydratase